MDFVSDTLTDGRRFCILAVMDDFSRECLCLVADTSLSGARVVRELDAIIARRGRPLLCVSDNGTELTSTEKQPSTEPRNTVTMGVTATQDFTFEWRKSGLRSRVAICMLECMLSNGRKRFASEFNSLVPIAGGGGSAASSRILPI